MKALWINRLRAWVDVQAKTPAQKRRGQVLAALLMITFGFLVLLWPAVMSWQQISPASERLYFTLQTPGVLLILACLFWLNRRGNTGLAAIVFLLGAVAWVSIFPFTTVERQIVVYAGPVLFASFVLTPAASFVLAAISTAAYSLNYSLAVAGGAVDIQYNLISVALMFFLASASALAAARLETAICTVSDSEAHYHALLDDLPLLPYQAEFGMDGRWLFAGKNTEKMLGFDVATWVADPTLWYHQIHPEDRARVERAEAHSQRTGEPFWAEYRIMHRDGHYLWVRDEASVVHRPGEPARLHGVMSDITEKKLAEEALREREAQLQSLVSSITDTVMVSNTNGEIIFVNEASAALYGMETAQQLVGRNLFNLVAKDSLETVFAAADRAIREGVVQNIQYFIQRAGKRVPVEVDFALLSDARGRPDRFLTVTRDISERFRSEQALRASEEQYRRLYSMVRLTCDNVPDLIWAKDLEGKYIFANKAICEKLLVADNTDEPTGQTDLYFAERQRQAHPHHLQWHTFGEICVDSDAVVLDIKKPQRFEEDGNVRGEFLLLDVYKAPFWDQDGNLIGVVGCGRDMTETRQLVEERRRLDERLERINATFLHFGADPDENINLLTSVCGELMGAACALYNGLRGGMLTTLAQWNTPEDYPSQDCPEGHICYDVICQPGDEVYLVRDLAHTRYMETDTNVSRYGLATYVGKPVTFAGRRAGSLCVVYQHDVVPSAADEKILGIIAAAIGVEDERARQLADLHESEEKFRNVAATALDAIFLINQENQVIFLNPAAERIFGCSAADVVGQPFDRFLPQNISGFVSEHSRRANRTGNGMLFQALNMTHQSGRLLPMEMSVSVYSVGGKEIFALIARDMEERNRSDAQIRASLREKEVLLREIHHRVKNNLQVMNSLLSLQSNYIKDPADLELFRESQSRVRSMALVHEELYRSKDLAQIDFFVYVQKLTANLFHAYGAGKLVDLHLDIENIYFGVDTAIPCGLIVNELVTNALKYAFPDGRRGDIFIGIRAHPDEIAQQNQYTLTVRDTGVGMPAGLDFRNTETLGLQLVNILTAQLQGQVNLCETRGHGVCFEIVFRQRHERSALQENEG